LREVTAAPVTIRIGDREWKLAPLTVGDLGELEQWCVDQPVNRLMDKLAGVGAGLPVETKTKLISDAINLSSTMTMMDEAPCREAASNAGRLRELWLSVKRADPSAKFTDFEAVVNAEPEGVFSITLATALKALRKASGLEGDPTADPTKATP